MSERIIPIINSHQNFYCFYFLKSIINIFVKCIQFSETIFFQLNSSWGKNTIWKCIFEIKNESTEHRNHLLLFFKCLGIPVQYLGRLWGHRAIRSRKNNIMWRKLVKIIMKFCSYVLSFLSSWDLCNFLYPGLIT